MWKVLNLHSEKYKLKQGDALFLTSKLSTLNNIPKSGIKRMVRHSVGENILNVGVEF